MFVAKALSMHSIRVEGASIPIQGAPPNWNQLEPSGIKQEPGSTVAKNTIYAAWSQLEPIGTKQEPSQNAANSYIITLWIHLEPSGTKEEPSPNAANNTFCATWIQARNCGRFSSQGGTCIR